MADRGAGATPYLGHHCYHPSRRPYSSVPATVQSRPSSRPEHRLLAPRVTTQAAQMGGAEPACAKPTRPAIDEGSCQPYRRAPVALPKIAESLGDVLDTGSACYQTCLQLRHPRDSPTTASDVCRTTP